MAAVTPQDDTAMAEATASPPIQFSLTISHMQKPGLDKVAQAFGIPVSDPASETVKDYRQRIHQRLLSVPALQIYTNQVVRSNIRLADSSPYKPLLPGETVVYNKSAPLTRRTTNDTAELEALLSGTAATGEDTDDELERLLNWKPEELEKAVQRDLEAFENSFTQPLAPDVRETARLALQARHEVHHVQTNQKTVFKHLRTLHTASTVNAQAIRNVGTKAIGVDNKLTTFQTRYNQDQLTHAKHRATDQETVQGLAARLDTFVEQTEIWKRRMSLVVFGHGERDQTGRPLGTIDDDLVSLFEAMEQSEMEWHESVTHAERTSTLPRPGRPSIPILRLELFSTRTRNLILEAFNQYADNWRAVHPRKALPFTVRKNLTKKQQEEGNITQAKVNHLRAKHGKDFRRRDNGVIKVMGRNGLETVDPKLVDKITQEEIEVQLRLMTKERTAQTQQAQMEPDQAEAMIEEPDAQSEAEEEAQINKLLGTPLPPRPARNASTPVRKPPSPTKAPRTAFNPRNRSQANPYAEASESRDTLAECVVLEG
ncbi:hypothetical protein BJ508DRAFT_374298 [Ascobolus immersus RN42]|uniref:Uncharacterized protein n=1 Tax=Ascobolus immersus RN42 TaxID=1160509 RepID=A0A3N4IDT3_ASCIM|nr:hypothetical protein BJ508DRAFT_374298 [Ascobolus immersus RN42]